MNENPSEQILINPGTTMSPIVNPIVNPHQIPNQKKKLAKLIMIMSQ